jgi:recombination protein RecT
VNTSITKPASPVAQLSAFLDKLKPQMALALPRHMSADRMTRLALTAFSTNRALQACTAQSIAASLMTAGQLGLEPGINGQGYLIPYGDTCTFVPGWRGLVDLTARSGRATVWTGAVYAGDDFDYQLGDSPHCRHRPGDGGEEFTHVYAIGRVKDAQMPVIEVWTRGKVKKHLMQYNKVGNRHYANSGENNFEMYARKVALLQVLKYMPSSIELSNAIAVSHAAEAGLGAMIDGDMVTLSAPPGEDAGAELLAAGDAAAAAGAVAYQKFWKSAGADGRKTLAGEHERWKAMAQAADAARTVDAKPEPEPQPKPQQAPVVSFAQIMDALVSAQKANDMDALDAAADLIGEVADMAQRGELLAKYSACQAKMAGGEML